MHSLPMVPESCGLSEDGVRAQIRRYRAIGEGAQAKRRDAMSLDVVVRRDVPERLIEELVMTERACCPFFALQWSPGERHLRIAVSNPADEPALGLTARAIGIEP